MNFIGDPAVRGVCFACAEEAMTLEEKCKNTRDTGAQTEEGTFAENDIQVVEADEIIDDRLRDEEAESLCRWGAARAGVIIVAPLVGTMSLVANEVYMVTRIGKVYGENLSQQDVLRLLASIGGCYVSSRLTTLIPFAPLQIPVAVGTTYGIGRVVIEWIKSGKTDDMSAFKKVYEDAVAFAGKNIDFLKDNPRRDEPLGDEKQHYDI
ncbi:MAG: hypothetical protein SPI71_06715 [Acidaminococcaceae bacterium]|nr:hypothetical protein [Acidaminococcaceae bacterium]